jgi:hypothetical protein
MKDMQTHFEELRVQITEYELIRDLATDRAKRELFDKLAAHFRVLASEVERSTISRAGTLKSQRPTSENTSRAAQAIGDRDCKQKDR